MRKIRTFFALTIVMTFTAGLLSGFGTGSIQAEAKTSSKPSRPVISIEAVENDTAVKVTISETKGADGYRIYMKAEGDSKYKKVKTLKKDGTKSRSTTITKLAAGTYNFKVKAYSKTSGKTVWSSYSKVRTLTLGKTAYSVGLGADEFVEANYPGLKTLADKGIIWIKAEPEDMITLGSWDCAAFDYEEYETVTDGKKDALKWKVLEYSEDGKSALVVSEYIIDIACYNQTQTDVTWETCDVRSWLNNEFYTGAFTEDERSLIKISEVKNEDNPDIGTKGGNDTKDHIFLLSCSEVNKYFGSNGNLHYMADRICGFIDGEGYWWALRTPGINNGCVTIVDDKGRIFDSVIDEDGFPVNSRVGIRPAFRIDLTDDIVNKNNLSIGGRQTVTSSDIYVTFGNWDCTEFNSDEYEFTKDGKKEALEWQILDYDPENNRILLVSRYLIDNLSYCKTPEGFTWRDKMNVTWEDATIRSWLNGEFYNGAFSDKERTLIGRTVIINEDNDEYGTPGGKDTYDNLFLLSLGELEKYIKTDIRHAYALNRICSFINGEAGMWFLRTPGDKADCAVLVESYGDVAVRGNYVYDERGIRPAFWMELKQ
ncbi:MAG: DUF6273 domain-containing protein [Lachnospiraceae bacterium]|nr:DUF6273 domain-containing protein [Lachnospiraceae bacterium]